MLRIDLNQKFHIETVFSNNLTVGISFNRGTEENIFPTDLPRINFCEGHGEKQFVTDIKKNLVLKQLGEK